VLRRGARSGYVDAPTGVASEYAIVSVFRGARRSSAVQLSSASRVSSAADHVFGVGERAGVQALLHQCLDIGRDIQLQAQFSLSQPASLSTGRREISGAGAHRNLLDAGNQQMNNQ